MMPQNAFQPLSEETAGAFPVPRRGMGHAAEALSNHHATARGLLPAGVATIIARRRLSRMHPRARRIFNVHAHADRRAPPGGDRVAVVKGNRIEEFDFESAEHKQLKGNIYLAKVTRVEPSLQAAFIDYGGNRHGFLAFSEIHPDYYQIPKADREALLREEAEHAAEEERLRAAEFDRDDNGGDGSITKKRQRIWPKTPRRTRSTRRTTRQKRGPDRTARPSTSPLPTNCERSGRTCAAATRSRTLSSAARCCWSRSSRKSAATRARR